MSSSAMHNPDPCLSFESPASQPAYLPATHTKLSRKAGMPCTAASGDLLCCIRYPCSCAVLTKYSGMRAANCAASCSNCTSWPCGAGGLAALARPGRRCRSSCCCCCRCCCCRGETAALPIPLLAGVWSAPLLLLPALALACSASPSPKLPAALSCWPATKDL